MDFFSEDPHSVVSPRDRVMGLAPPGKTLSQELSLERLAFITFTSQDLKGLIDSGLPSKPLEAWRERGFRIFRKHVRDKGWVAARSPYGAPGTVMLLEELVAFGVRRVVLLGYCGALLEGIGIGDIVLPVEAVREEGTSYHYLPKNEKSCPDLLLQGQLSDWIGGVGLSSLRGKVWTTDAPYRETLEKVRAYRAEGVLGVEMEMAAAFAFGKAKGISIGSVLIVSDQVREGHWHIDFFSPKIQSAREKVVQALLGHLPELGDP